MNYGSGFAVGIACGIGCGIGCGIASGRKKAMEDLRAYAERRQIVIQDRDGRAIAINELLEDGLRPEAGRNRTALLVGLVLLGVVMLGALAFFLFLR